MKELLRKLKSEFKAKLGLAFDATNTTLQEAAKASTALWGFAKAAEANASFEELERHFDLVGSVLDVLNDPIVEMAEKTVPLLAVGTGLLKMAIGLTQKEPSFEDSVAIVGQAAYLESMRQFLRANDDVWAKLDKNRKKASEELEWRIRNFDLDTFGEKEAKDVLFHFHESSLAGELNSILADRLAESGLEEAEAKIVAERISWGSHRYVRKAIADVAEEAKELAKIYGNGGYALDLEAQHNLDEYLQDIAAKTEEKIFGKEEEFAYQDLYVPLEVKPVENGEVQENAAAIAIEQWAENLLLDEKKGDRVLFLQGGPGRGKSVFCRMFAARVRQRLYPIWTPIVIRLRDLGATLSPSFEETLKYAVARGFAKSDRWLSDPNTRFLFFLDGFDELLLERGGKTDLKEFLEQVGRFQRTCNESRDYQHRIIITGRPLALFGIDRQMPSNLERVELELMSDELQEQWLAKWEVRVGKEKTQAFREFLRAEGCPEQVQNLAREPLLLYLLAGMHRDDRIAIADFAGEDAGAAKVRIYDKVLEWVLEKQRSQGDRNLNFELTQLAIEHLPVLLAEAALCVVQSGVKTLKLPLFENACTRTQTPKNCSKKPKKRACAIPSKISSPPST